MNDVPRLITFAPMIDSEVWRLLLRYYGVAYQEEPHAFIWGSIVSLVHAGSVQVPALYGTGLKLVGPESAIDRWDSGQAPGRALVPPDPAMHAVAMADWALFHGSLSTYTARLAYYHLLPNRTLMMEPFTRGLAKPEVKFTQAVYPLQRGLLSLLLQLKPANAEAALVAIRGIFDQTDARVGDGRRFLQGDRLTLGDIALAAAAAPVTLPEGNRSPIPPLSELPAAYAAAVTELRARPTGRFVQNFYTFFYK